MHKEITAIYTVNQQRNEVMLRDLTLLFKVRNSCNEGTFIDLGRFKLINIINWCRIRTHQTSVFSLQ